MKRPLPLAEITAVFGLLVPAAVGWFTTPYDATRQFISELGARGAPTSVAVSYGVFLPTGLLALATGAVLFARLDRQRRWPALLLLAGLGIGNVGAAFVPCDLGCPAIGSPRQGLHNLMGLLQYLSGGAALLWLGRRARQPWLAAAGALVLVSLWMMGGPGQAWRGLWQRAGELMLYGSLPVLARRSVSFNT